MKDLIKKQEIKRIIDSVKNPFKYENTLTYNPYEVAERMIEELLKETAEYEKDRIKEKVEDWRRGFSMTCAESDIYEKAHQQILRVLKDI